ncbi:hypothetical protein DFS34DRAFT_595728 [Phlyctochytrium arcticum]|nr:hypothetical protein DFS34DRAFT_595728 [Phlyctochytrium arcticum]
MAGSRLPIETMAVIAGEIDDVKTLRDLSSVSLAWHQVTQSMRYRSIAFRASLGFRSQIQLLLRTLKKNPQLGGFVQELKVRGHGSNHPQNHPAYNADFYAEMGSLASLCPNVTRLDLSSFIIEDQDLMGILENSCCLGITSNGFVKVLPFLKNLRKLDVSVDNLDDKCFCEISQMCPLLEDLSLWFTSVTRTGLSSIMELATNLKSLNLPLSYRTRLSEMEAIMKEKPRHLTIAICKSTLWYVLARDG